MSEQSETLKKELDELFQKMLSLRNAKYLVKQPNFDEEGWVDDLLIKDGWEKYNFELNGKRVIVTYTPCPEGKEFDPEYESIIKIEFDSQSIELSTNPDGSYNFTGTYSNTHAKTLYDEIFDNSVPNEEITEGEITVKVDKDEIKISGKNLPKKDKQEAQNAKGLAGILQAVGAEELIEMCHEIDEISKTADTREPIGTQIGSMFDMESIKAAISDERLENIEHTMDTMANIKKKEKSKDNTDSPNLDD